MELQTLIDERRRARDGTERCRLSKCIQKSSRKELRRWHTEQAKQILGGFKDLDRLNGILKTPFTRSVIAEQVKSSQVPIEPARARSASGHGK